MHSTTTFPTLTLTAIVLFTDGERVDSTEEQEQIEQTVRNCATRILTPLFIFAIEGM